jgi:hypothetical protein
LKGTIKMKTITKNIKAILLFIGIAAVIFFAGILTRPGYTAMNNNSSRPRIGQWLSQYEGQTVKITFISAPIHIAADLEKISSLTLLEAGQNGIVVTFRPQRTVFFPYSQIISIEPIYTNR